MLGLFRRILSRSEAPHAAPPAPVTRPPLLKPRAAATAPGPVRVKPLAPPASKPSPTSAVQASAAPVTSSPVVTPPPASATHINVTLAAIAASLPEALRHKVPASADQFVAVPIDRILPRLANGQVILTAAELRECSPESFAALVGHDDVPMTLPLAEIVKQLSTQHFARRPQRRIEIPQEVVPIFTGSGDHFSIAKSAAAQPAPAYRAQPSATTTTVQTPPAPAPASKISVSPQALAALKAATSAPGTEHPTAPAPRAMTPAPAAPEPAPTPAPAPAPRAVTPSPAKKNFSVAPKPAGELPIPLSIVHKEWVQEVRAQLTDVNIEQHQIMMPLELLEPAMKSGKVLFTWEEVAAWIQPPLPSPPTPKVGAMLVELPLKTIAPIFMSHHRAGAQKRVAVDETIPDLFNGGNGNGANSNNGVGALPSQPASAAPAPAAPARQTTPATATAPVAPTRMTPAPAPKIETPSASPEDSITLEELVGSNGSRYSAKDIVAHASRLPGVSGALLAMNDGLLVTSHTPPSVKAETIAAFLPQMFGRMNQYTKELTLGPLQQLTLGVEGGQWHVIKRDTIYFAVLGKHGDTLPLNLLAQIAAELSIQSK